MEDAEPWNEQQLAAMRAILLDWNSLSRGDISIVLACIRDPKATTLTVDGSAHAKLWHALTRIGWAEQLYSLIDPYEHDPEPVAFRLVPGAERPLSHFLVYYDLLNMGACTPAGGIRAVQTGDLDSVKAQIGEASRSPVGQSRTLTNARFAGWLWGTFALLMIGAAVGRAAFG